MSNIIFPATVFYTTVIVLMTLLGATLGDGSEIIEFPSVPSNPTLEGIPILGFFVLLIEYLAFFVLVIGFLFKMVGFTLFDFIPWWLNTIIFLPLVVTILYETIARLIRGS